MYNIIYDDPQGSILGPPSLFTIFLMSYIFEHEHSCSTNYGDVTAPCVITSNTKEVTVNLTSITKKLFLCVTLF